MIWDNVNYFSKVPTTMCQLKQLGEFSNQVVHLYGPKGYTVKYDNLLLFSSLRRVVKFLAFYYHKVLAEGLYSTFVIHLTC